MLKYEEITEGLELDFIRQFMDDEKKCECPNPNCNVINFKKTGKRADYIISVDTKPKELEPNVLIKVDMTPAELQRLNPLLFNGRCDDNIDFAKALNMVILE